MPVRAEDPEAGDPSDAAPSWVVVACAGRRYVLPLERIHEIVTPQPLTRAPGCGPAVAGLAGMRGRVVTIFDLSAVLAQERAISLPDHRVLLFEHGDRILGVAVDECLAVIRAPLRAPLAPEERLDGLDADEAHVVGTDDFAGETLPAPNVDLIIGRLLRRAPGRAR
jgi:chemotaxis signal transduction protein